MQKTKNKAEKQVQNHFRFRINGNASMTKREIVLENIDCLYDVLKSYQNGGIDSAVSYFENVDLFDKMLSDLGINLSNESLTKYGLVYTAVGYLMKNM